jgi:pre-mRNA-splicing factor SYF1
MMKTSLRLVMKLFTHTKLTPTRWIGQMFTIYIAKAAANYGLPATRAIYERAIEILPPKQTAEMCLRFAALERKLGEIDRARAVYAHASQFCDPRVRPEFWAAWNAFEIDTGSEDTFREMLRVKRSVQAQFNTEASYLAAQSVAAKQGAASTTLDDTPADPMAAAEKAAAPAFVAAKTNPVKPAQEPSSAPDTNAEEIHMSDDEDL